MSGLRFKVLKTSAFHNGDILYWFDGTTAETLQKMQTILGFLREPVAHCSEVSTYGLLPVFFYRP